MDEIDEIHENKIFDLIKKHKTNTQEFEEELDKLSKDLLTYSSIKTQVFENKKVFKTSKYYGVHFVTSISKFRALFTYNKTRLYLGSYSNEIDAAKIYNRQALYLNNKVKTRYKLNYIENFITEPCNYIYEHKH